MQTRGSPGGMPCSGCARCCSCSNSWEASQNNKFSHFWQKPHIGTAAHSCRYSSSLFGAARQLLHQTADQLKRLSNGAQGNNFLPRPFHFFACQPSVRSHFDGLPPADSRRGLHGHLSIHTRLPRRGRDQLRQRCAAHPAQTIAPLALRVPRTSREPAPPEPVWLPGLASTTLATARAAVA